jgi:hypothetical protein
MRVYRRHPGGFAWAGCRQGCRRYDVKTGPERSSRPGPVSQSNYSRKRYRLRLFSPYAPTINADNNANPATPAAGVGDGGGATTSTNGGLVTIAFAPLSYATVYVPESDASTVSNRNTWPVAPVTRGALFITLTLFFFH